MTDRKPLARYGAMESALRERLAPAELHHKLGHGPYFIFHQLKRRDDERLAMDLREAKKALQLAHDVAPDDSHVVATDPHTEGNNSAEQNDRYESQNIGNGITGRHRKSPPNGPKH